MANELGMADERGMANKRREAAAAPEDLSRLFTARFSAGDLDGLVALYEPEAVLALPAGQVARGSEEIRFAYRRLIADCVNFMPGRRRAPLRNGDLALTSRVLGEGLVTVEVARRQADGTWLWAIDSPNILGLDR